MAWKDFDRGRRFLLRSETKTRVVAEDAAVETDVAFSSSTFGVIAGPLPSEARINFRMRSWSSVDRATNPFRNCSFCVARFSASRAIVYVIAASGRRYVSASFAAWSAEARIAAPPRQKASKLRRYSCQ